MKAAVLLAPRKVVVTEVPDLVPKKGEIVIRVHSVGVCPTDLRYYTGLSNPVLWDGPLSYGETSYGLTGHEVSGTVEKLGDAVSDFQVGDHVVPDSYVSCGKCVFCASGEHNLCSRKLAIGRGYAELMRVPAGWVHKVSEKLPLEKAAYAEPLAVMLNNMRKLRLEPGDTVLVVGGGPMGLLAAMLVKLFGGKPVVSEVQQSRIDFARKMGVEAYPPETLSEIFQTENRVADRVILTVVNKDTLAFALKNSRNGAIITLFGSVHPKVDIPLDLNNIHYGEKVILGVSDYAQKDMYHAIKMLESNTIEVEKLVTAVYSLKEIENAFEEALSGRQMKVQIRVQDL